MRANVGFVVLLAKLGPKLFPLLVKLQDALITLAKSLFGFKAAGVAASVGIYSLLLSWQMGIALVVFIAIHEYGHLWAMKQCGIRTRGMFFIPGFGAVAVADEKFGSAGNEAYIALMGPVFGLLFFVAPASLYYLYTGEPLYAVIASFTAFINLINLLPVVPLDGGRVLKALAYSPNLGIALGITVGISLVATAIAVPFGYYLIAVMAFVGLWEVAQEFGIHKHVRDVLTTLARVAVVSLLWIVLPIAFSSTSTWWVQLAGGMVAVTVLGMMGADAWTLTISKNKTVLQYPLQVLKSFWAGVQSLWALKTETLQPIENYMPLAREGKVFYGACFLLLILIHLATFFLLDGPTEGLVTNLLT